MSAKTGPGDVAKLIHLAERIVPDAHEQVSCLLTAAAIISLENKVTPASLSALCEVVALVYSRQPKEVRDEFRVEPS